MPSSEHDESSEAEHQRAQIQKDKKKKRLFLHKYKSSWESHLDFRGWIKPSPQSETMFYCSYCSAHYKCGKAEVIKHMKTKKHSTNAAEAKTRQTINNMTAKALSIDEKRKANEIKICMFLVEHNLSFNISDHLTKLFQSLDIGSGDCVKRMSCAKTKATALVKNVIGKQSMEDICKTIKETKFSLIIDESTDLGCVKHLALVARYFKDNNVRDSFLGIIQTADASASKIYSLIVEFFNNHGIDYKTQMIGFAADGTNSMMGKNNSVQALLTKDVPHLFVLKCICHSFALCASYASQQLPNEPENLARKVYNYMRYSFKRREEFKEFQKFVNVNPHKLLHPCQTRWLSLVAVVERLLEQYSALEIYFRAEVFDSKSTSDKDPACLEIYDLLNDLTNKLYLEFMAYVLPLFTNLNKVFESEDPKIHTLYTRVSQLYKTILDMYIKVDYLNQTALEQVQYRNPANYVPLEEIYVGPKIAIALGENSRLSRIQIHNFRLKCLNFLIEAAHQIYQRFPLQSEFLKLTKEMNVIDPEVIFRERPQTIAPLASKFPHLVPDINTLDLEWRMFRNDPLLLKLFNDYQEKESTKSEVNVVTFWRKFENVCNANSNPKYRNLLSFVYDILTLPNSSANTERLFSVINLNKTKTRNKLGTDTLSAILYSKELLNNSECYKFKVQKCLIKAHNNNIYD